MRYFAKRNLEVLPPGLKAEQFEVLVQGYGHIATDDEETLKAIDAVLGKAYAFFEITKTQYEETVEQAKKNLSATGSPTGYSRNVMPQIKPSEPKPDAPPVAAATEAAKPATPAAPPIEESPSIRRNPLQRKPA